MEGRCEADFASFFAVDLGVVLGRDSLCGRITVRTPFKADLAARLALALCLPPMGAMNQTFSNCSCKHYKATQACPKQCVMVIARALMF